MTEVNRSTVIMTTQPLLKRTRRPLPAWLGSRMDGSGASAGRVGSHSQ